MARQRRATSWFALLLAPAIAAACARDMAIAVPARPATRVAGDVREVDLGARRLTLLDAGRLRVVDLTPATAVRRGRTEASLEDLKKGDRVVVSMAAEPPYGARLIAVAGRVAPPSPVPESALP
jgi:Cu/Ag efflux protein CusF